MEQIVDALTRVVRLMVDSPDEVSLEMIPRTHSVTLRISVAPADAGKVIGKQGRTARSLRTLLNAMSQANELTTILEIVESKDNKGQAGSLLNKATCPFITPPHVVLW